MEAAPVVSSSERTSRRLRVRRSLAALRGKAEPPAPTTPGRKSRFQEDASVGGTLLPSTEVTPEPHSLVKAGRFLAGMNPLNVMRSLKKTYTTTKEDIVVDNIEHSRMRSTTSLASEPYGIRPSASKKDLREQQKLSKRVSDLEYRLEKARKALDTSIQKTSPMPVLTSPYEKYTPRFASSVSRKSFVPGLPTLHSERRLFPDINVSHLSLDEHNISRTSLSAGKPTEPREHITTNTINTSQDRIDIESDQSFDSDVDMSDIHITDSSPTKGNFYMQQNATILPSSSSHKLINQAAKGGSYLQQNISILHNTSPQDITMADDQYTERIDSFQDLASLNSDEATPTQNKSHFQITDTLMATTTSHSRVHSDNGPGSDDLTPTQNTSHNHSAIAGAADDTPSRAQNAPLNLDAKLNTLEQAVKANAKSTKPKKRKSHLDDGDQTFKPDGADDDSDYSEGRARLRKKRKSTDKTNTGIKTSSRTAAAKSAATPKKTAQRKITKPAPAPAPAKPQTPAFELRGLLERKTSSRLDMIDEDTEADTSIADEGVAADAVDTTTTHGAMPEKPNTAFTTSSEDPTAGPTTSKYAAAAAKNGAPADSLTSAGVASTTTQSEKTESPKLTRENLQRHDGRWDWPDDVF
ncbi:Hypothetical protein D9617_5g070770 [Elsinoe fawcettii]|nr:Hypothetical protein D9617_5g070770 [Elsinoe fawcettii]